MHPDIATRGSQDFPILPADHELLHSGAVRRATGVALTCVPGVVKKIPLPPIEEESEEERLMESLDFHHYLVVIRHLHLSGVEIM